MNLNVKGRALGIDIGSTTTKLVLVEKDRILYERYERHLSRVREKTLEMILDIKDLLSEAPFSVAVSGSAGMGVTEATSLPFVQEVYATGEAVKNLAPDTSAVIELGGEDAKVIFFDGGIDERMNGSCAGGTGAFIDQMAVLLNMSVTEMDEESLKAKRIYPIASRCGVFAKTDIQPLLNQGAQKSDVAASIYQAVVNQTITGLAQGRSIGGKVLFLGGPLYYCKGLRIRFRETLKLDDEHAVFPDYGRFAVALGAALYSETTPQITFDTLEKELREAKVGGGRDRLAPLFETDDDYRDFVKRHEKATVNERDLETYKGKAWLGIDCGSTTTKLVLISEDKDLLYTYYSPNRGDPVSVVKSQLEEIRRLCGDRVTICGSTATGYGEELIKNAFKVDFGVVETIAHYTAAKYFRPNVDFILDIGGQDIKCFRIRGGAIDSIMLNEACSSGCGSFIETFARSMGYSVSDFAEMGLHGKAPVNLGSRCTVFMNSSVKQSQKEGATAEDISAGLSISVVKNAIYKVIRASSPDELGKNIVVQGGTFHNDAVLRAFENELGAEVIRPSIAGLMGAYGAALYAMDMELENSDLLTLEELLSFKHTAKSAICQGCENHCHLTVNSFGEGGKKFISGNQCQKALGAEDVMELPNLYAKKREYFANLSGTPGNRGRIGLPLALGMFELAPLWHGIFTSLGFETVFSRLSTRATYEKGQFSIPSDTACYPAKIMHGHIEELIEQGVERIFYPSLTYNVDERSGVNHYNCPVVAYYAELLAGNMDSLKKVDFMYPYLNVNSRSALVRTLGRAFEEHGVKVSTAELKRAVKAGFEEYEDYVKTIRREGEAALDFAEKNGKRVMILAGRPYHIDPEICHGIDKLASSLGFVVVSEDSVFHLAKPGKTRVLNQWTFHARLYRAAELAAKLPGAELVQLVSFGCGVDAITTDEVREVLESKGKFYTQIKIDEITNLGAVKIRLRSLVGSLEDKERRSGKEANQNV